MNRALFFKFLFLFLLVIFFSCNQKNRKKLLGFKERKIKLDSSLIIIPVNLPARLNEYIQWSDKYNEPFCGRQNYRFFDDNYSNEKYKIDNSDSVYQFTVWQTDLPQNQINRRPCFSKIDSLEILGEPWQLTDSYTEYKIREFRLINGRLLSVLAATINSFPDKRTLQYVLATTCFEDERLQFVAQCRAKDTTDFFANMYKSMLSIKIAEGN